jgi:hypothetical protein
MRTFKLIAVAVLAASTAACVETVDQGYGYSDGYYAPDYAAQQPAYYGSSYGSNAYAPSYYAPQPQVITQTRYQTRYVPVPTPVPVPVRDANRSNDYRWDGNRGDQHHDRPQAQNAPHPGPTPHQPPPNSGGNNQHGGNGNNSHDRDGDGRPDHHN